MGARPPSSPALASLSNSPRSSEAELGGEGKPFSSETPLSGPSSRRWRARAGRGGRRKTQMHGSPDAWGRGRPSLLPTCCCGAGDSGCWVQLCSAGSGRPDWSAAVSRPGWAGRGSEPPSGRGGAARIGALVGVRVGEASAPPLGCWENRDAGSRLAFLQSAACHFTSPPLLAQVSHQAPYFICEETEARST